MQLEFAGKQFELAAGESVLECLERHGERVDSLCRSGVCQSCVMRADSGTVPAAAQQGLKESWREQGLFMACVCRPAGDLRVARCDVLPTHVSRVVAVELLSPRVMRVHLSMPPGFAFAGGQFIQLLRPGDGLMRSYSIASQPDDETLQLHVSKQVDGQMSGWLAGAVGETVQLRGPLGECSYVAGEPDRPLLLAGTGTGLAPLQAVMRSALRGGHTGPVYLFHGAAEQRELYLWPQLRELAARHPTLRVAGSVLDASTSTPDLSSLPLPELVMRDAPPAPQLRAYLCGNPEFVRGMRKQLYLRGTPLSRIHADPFVPPAAGH